MDGFKQLLKLSNFTKAFNSIGYFFLVAVVPMVFLYLIKLYGRKRSKTIAALDKCIVFRSSLSVRESKEVEALIIKITRSFDTLLGKEQSRKSVPLEVSVSDALATLPLLVRIADVYKSLAFAARGGSGLICIDLIERLKGAAQNPLRTRLEEELELLKAYKKQKRKKKILNIFLMAVHIVVSYMIAGSLLWGIEAGEFPLAVYCVGLLLFPFRFEPRYSVEISRLRKTHFKKNNHHLESRQKRSWRELIPGKNPGKKVKG